MAVSTLITLFVILVMVATIVGMFVMFVRTANSVGELWKFGADDRREVDAMADNAVRNVTAHVDQAAERLHIKLRDQLGLNLNASSKAVKRSIAGFWIAVSVVVGSSEIKDNPAFVVVVLAALIVLYKVIRKTQRSSEFRAQQQTSTSGPPTLS